ACLWLFPFVLNAIFLSGLLSSFRFRLPRASSFHSRAPHSQAISLHTIFSSFIFSFSIAFATIERLFYRFISRSTSLVRAPTSFHHFLHFQPIKSSFLSIKSLSTD
ncbi:hypothetical protein VIGAN_04166500, partial [Vigna angularis var. angularis]